jgi:hypothetical protein
MTNTLKGTTITTFDISHTPGHYQFCGLPAGSYYVIASVPDSLINPIRPDSLATDSTISADSVTNATLVPERTSSFTISCSNNNNEESNIIIVPTTNCDDDCSKRKPILFKPLF